MKRKTPPKPVSSRQLVAIDNVYRNASIEHQRGNGAIAKQGYLKVLANYVDHVPSLLGLSAIAHDDSAFDVAYKLASKAASIDPANAVSFNYIGLAELGRQNVHPAIGAFKAAIEIRPDFIEAWNNLGNALKREKCFSEARSAFENAINLDPAFSHAYYNLGLLLQAQQLPKEAKPYFIACLDRDPTSYKSQYQLGQIAETEGEFDTAVKMYLAALAQQPEYVSALTALLAIKSFVPNDELIQQAERNALRKDLLPTDQFGVCYALGKQFERLSDFDKAFYYINLANRRRGEHRTYDRRIVEAQFLAYRKTFTKDTILELSSRVKSHARLTERPVFIVGMPRTGTTLVEQILGSHPSIFGAGELPDLPRIINDWRQGRLGYSVPNCVNLKRTFPGQLPDATSEELDAMADRYISALNSKDTGSARIIDKNPFNFLNIGLIKVLFPNAHIIHCHRNPLDVGFSCYSELFELKQDFTTDLGNIGHYYTQYHTLIQHFKTLNELSIFDVRYEDVVADTEKSVREILEFVGLPWHPDCLQFHKRDSTVLTPSKWQVRQPIYKSSRARWKRFEKYLQPLIQPLQNANLI